MRIREAVRHVWREGNNKTRAGMVILGLGIGAVNAGAVCELASSVEINNHGPLHLGDEALLLVIGGGAITLTGQNLYHRGVRDTLQLPRPEDVTFAPPS